MSSNMFYATICFLMGVITFFFWWHEMFSDGPVGEFSRAFDSDRGKNFLALTIPAIGTFLISGSVLAFSSEVASPFISQLRHPGILYAVLSSLLGAVGILSLLVFVASFIPFSLPEWMYPEYHAAKREEQRRREAAERGEALDRNPFLDDNGVYASQLGNVPVNTPPTVGLPATGDPPPLQGPPEAEDPALYDINATGAFDITATTAALPRTGAPTSRGIRPVRAARARRGRQEGGDAPTAGNATDEPDSTDETEHPSASSEALPMPPPESPPAEP